MSFTRTHGLRQPSHKQEPKRKSSRSKSFPWEGAANEEIPQPTNKCEETPKETPIEVFIYIFGLLRFDFIRRAKQQECKIYGASDFHQGFFFINIFSQQLCEFPRADWLISMVNKGLDNEMKLLALRVLQTVKIHLKLEFFNEKNALSSVKFSL